jgi:flagellar motor protein MotB
MWQSRTTRHRESWRRSTAFGSLCQQPVLLALELDPDCESGVITLSDDLFEGSGKAQLGALTREDIVAAMTTYLSHLRTLPALWESLEAIEIRGHADPSAVRDPYSTNMMGSQQRALGVLLFLVGPEGLGEEDRIELQRLAIVSGVSFARPPASCPERSRECYPEWRRVEIRPVLSESSRRRDWSKTVQDARNAALRGPDRNFRRIDSAN